MEHEALRSMDSPLRRLARDYFEGRIDRPEYLAQRKQLICSLPAEPRAMESILQQGAATENFFAKDDAASLSSDDLVSALAGRGESDESNVFPAEGLSPLADDISGSFIQEQIANSANGRHAKAAPVGEPSARACDERRLRRRYWLWLVVTASCVATMVYILWLS